MNHQQQQKVSELVTKWLPSLEEPCYEHRPANGQIAEGVHLLEVHQTASGNCVTKPLSLLSGGHAVGKGKEKKRTGAWERMMEEIINVDQPLEINASARKIVIIGSGT